MKKKTFKVGAIVRVIRQPSGMKVITTVTGLYGFVVAQNPGPWGDCMVLLYGGGMRVDDSSSSTVAFSDLEACSDAKWKAFLKPLIAAELRQRREPNSPAVEKIMRSSCSAAGRKKDADRRADEKAWADANPDKFQVPRGIKRNDKGNYMAYRSPECQAVESVRRELAYGDMKDVGNRVTLGRTNAFLDQASFWPDREFVRNMVRELDLDPYAGWFNRAIYKEFSHPRTTTEDLRKRVIELLNKGHVILELTPVNEDDSCRCDGDFWYITTGKRRKLPVA